MVRISIDQKKCAGCGFCVNYAPDLFKFDTKQFKAKLKQKNKFTEVLLINLSPKQTKEIKDVIKGCPAQAIKLSK